MSDTVSERGPAFPAKWKERAANAAMILAVPVFIAIITGECFYLDTRSDAEHPLSISRFEVRGVERFFLDEGDDFEALVPNGTGGYVKTRYRSQSGRTEYRHDVPDGDAGWIEGVTFKNWGVLKGSDGKSYDVHDGGFGDMVVHYGGAPLAPGTIEKACKTCPPTHALQELR